MAIKHGMTGTRTFIAWTSMHSRCKGYGGGALENYVMRGIVVDPSWRTFEQFFADMGECPAGLSLDRVNNELGYSKENCRWATRAEQSQNMRTTKLTLEKARTIKQELAANPDPVRGFYSRLAEKFGVSRFIISEIAKGNNWRTA